VILRSDIRGPYTSYLGVNTSQADPWSVVIRWSTNSNTFFLILIYSYDQLYANYTVIPATERLCPDVSVARILIIGIAFI